MKKLICIALTLGLGMFVQAQSEVDKVKETVNKTEIEGHIYFLSDDLLKGREAGTAENKIAAAYLANAFRSYGVKPNPKTGTYYQKFGLKKIQPPKKVHLDIKGQTYPNIVALVPGGITAKGGSVFIGYGMEADYENVDVRGKVVLAKAGNSEGSDPRAAFGLRKQKAELAKKAGAVALVEFLHTNTRIWEFIDHNFNGTRMEIHDRRQVNDGKEVDFSHAWVLDKDGSYTSSFNLNETNPTGYYVLAGEVEVVGTQNVVGIIEGTDPKLKNEYIIYSAHYDHVGIGSPDASGDTIYNGARDNAVGTTTVLSMAENLAKYPTKRSALFIMFTAEEKGLLGSEYYVENPIIPLNQMVFCFNSDNGGYNDTSLTTIVGLERTTASGHIKSASSAFGLTAIDDPAPEQGLFDRSDNVHFARKGIPAPTFSMGFSAFDDEINKYYHQPGDHADSIDFDYLEKFFRAYVLSGRNIGNDETTPFWTAGDKYEAAGKELYDK